MSDGFYRLCRTVGWPVFRSTSRPVVLGVENIPSTPKPDGFAGKQPAFILAPTHESPYDIVILIAHTPRLVDFVSIVEVFRNPIVAWFYGSLNAFPLDRSRPDSGAVRTILSRLAAGRVICMFPEGRLRSGLDSVVHSRKIKPGIGRIAALSGTPIVPCVIINSGTYRKPQSWLPFFRTRYGVIYGKPIAAENHGDKVEEVLVESMVKLHAQLKAAMDTRAGRTC